jgi:hypothetical protein
MFHISRFAVILYAANISLFADPLLREGLATVHALNFPGNIEIDTYFLQTPEYRYSGTVNSTYVNASSYFKNRSLCEL